jgi:hypothetical protein
MMLRNICDLRKAESIPIRFWRQTVKTWCVSYRFGGKLTRYTFASFPIIKLAEARQTAADALHDVAHGINPATKKKVERNSETFDYLAGEYLERHPKPKKKSWGEDGESSKRICFLLSEALVQRILLGKTFERFLTAKPQQHQ